MRTTRVPFPRGGRRLLAPLLLLLAYLPGWTRQAQPIGSLLTSRNTSQAWRLALLAWLVLLLTWLAPPLKAQTVHWQKTYGLTYTSGSSTQTSNNVNAAVATPDGGFLLAGNTTQIIPGTTSPGYFGLVVKVDASGNELWKKTCGLTTSSGGSTSARNYLTAAVATPDGGFLLAGQTIQNIPGSIITTGTYGLLVKVDASGNVLWQKIYGSTYIYNNITAANNGVDAVVTAPDGGFLLAGYTTQYSPGGTTLPGRYGLLVKVDASGQVLWQKTYGQSYIYYNAILAGTALRAAIAIPDGGFLLAGYTAQSIPGNGYTGQYGLLVKVDASGNVLWQKTCGLTYRYNNNTDANTYAGNGVNTAVATPDGGFLLAGYTTQNLPGSTTAGTYGLVVKVNASGSVLSQQTYGLTASSSGYTSATNRLYAAVATPDGGFLLAGFTEQTVPAAGRYGLLVKVNASGQALWPAPRTVPWAAGLTNHFVTAAAAMPGSGFLLAGQVSQNPGTPAGQYGWAARLDSGGLLLQQADGTAQAVDKPFRLLWQPILTVGGLDSLARPQRRGTVTTFQGGRVLLPPSMQVTDAKGFYFFQEGSPAAGQDTLFYGLYVRNTPLANGAKDDTLRHLYQCRRSFGSQAGLLTGSLQPLPLGSSSTAQRVAPLEEATPTLRPRPISANRAGQRPPAPRRSTPRLAEQPLALPAPQQRVH